MKYLKWIALAVIVLLLVAGLIVYLSINGIVKRKVESQATQQLNLKTDLSSAQVSLFGGNVKLNGLEIASPQGFAAPHLFTLGQADMSVKLGELRNDPVHVTNITLNKPKLLIEQSGTQLNFKKAMDLIPKGPAQTTPENSAPLKVVINELTIQDPSVVIRPGLPGLAQEIVLQIPTLTMKNIGTGEGAQNGAAVKDVVMQVITVLAAEAANSNGLPEQLKQLLKLNVQDLVAGLAPQLQQRIAEALPGELGKAVGGLLNDPNALMKDPGKVIQENAAREGGKLLQGVLGGGKEGSTTQPADPLRNAVEQGAGQAIQGLLGGKKNKKDKSN